jgi:hypothetical protein
MNSAPASMTARAVAASVTVPGAKQEPIGHRRGQFANQIDCPRHGHRHFKSAHAAGRQGRRRHPGRAPDP